MYPGIVENPTDGQKFAELLTTRRVNMFGTWLSSEPTSPGRDLNGRPRIILTFLNETSTDVGSAVMLSSTVGESMIIRFEIGDPDNGEYFIYEKE